MKHKRELILIGLVVILIARVFTGLGAAFGLRMLAEMACFTIIALGLTIQWGYAGLFNAGIMGFIALSAFVSMFVSYPVNTAFWESGHAGDLAGVLLRLATGIAMVWGLNRLPALQNRIGVRRLRHWEEENRLRDLDAYLAELLSLIHISEPTRR